MHRFWQKWTLKVYTNAFSLFSLISNLIFPFNNQEYKEVVGRAWRELGNQQCYNRIQNGIAELESMFANNRVAEVKAMMKLCKNFDENNELDVQSFFDTITNLFCNVAQSQE